MKKVFWLGLALSAGLMLGGCGGSSSGSAAQAPGDNNNVEAVSGQVLVPDNGAMAASNRLEWFNWLLSVAHAQEQQGTEGLVGRMPNSVTIKIFDPDAEGGPGYVDLGVDLSDGLTLEGDGRFEIVVDEVGDAVRDAAEARFPGREFDSFLAEDCVISVQVTINGEEQEVRVPLVLPELDLSPASEFLSQELEDGGDFTNVTLDEVSELLSEVEGIAASADGATSVQEVVARLREATGDSIRQQVEIARQAEGDADSVSATYDLVWLELNFFGAEDPDDGASVGFGSNLAVLERFPSTVTGSGSELSIDVGSSELSEVELEAFGSGDSLGYNVRTDEFPESRSENFDGRVTADGSFSLFLPAFQFVDTEEGSGEIQAATTLLFRPTGDTGGFVATPAFRGAEYELDDNGNINLSRRTSREAGQVLALAIERPDQDVTSLSGAYGSVVFSLLLGDGGALEIGSTVLEREFGSSPYTGSFDSTFIARETDMEGNVSVIRETFAGTLQGMPELASPNRLTLDETLMEDGEEEDTRRPTGFVLGGGEAFALMDFVAFEEEGASFGEVILEYNVQLADSGAPNAAGRSFRLQGMDLKVEGGPSQAQAPSQLIGINATLDVPEGGLMDGGEVTIRDERASEVARDNDAGRLMLSQERPESTTLTVTGFDSNNGRLSLADSESATTLEGFISADGETLVLTIVETDEIENFGSAGLLVGTALPESE